MSGNVEDIEVIEPLQGGFNMTPRELYSQSRRARRPSLHKVLNLWHPQAPEHKHRLVGGDLLNVLKLPGEHIIDGVSLDAVVLVQRRPR